MNEIDFKASWNGLKTLLVKRCTPSFWRLYRRLQRTQWMDVEQLEVFQLERLQRLVRHAYGTVPYWRRRMDELQIRPTDIRSLGDIQRFPIMSKQDLKQVGDEILSWRYPRFLLRTAYTGGTTGLPVPIRRDPWSIAREHAFVRRQFDWAGIGPKDRCAYLEGRVVVPPGQTATRLYYYDAVLRELTLSTFHLTGETGPMYVEAIRRYGIKALVAYPSAATILAHHCRQKDLSLKLKCVLTTSETLDEGKKKLIEEAFCCPVFDFYGSAERVVYIHTCEKGSYHVVPEYGYTELVPAGPPNEDCCRVISTGFWNLAMPLIRYDMGDLVRPSDRVCACGRAFPVVEKIIGRDGSSIRTPGGLELGASAIECILARVLYAMYEMPVETGRVVLEEPSRLILEYVPAHGFAEDHEKTLLRVMGEQTPEGMRSEIRRMDRLDRTPRGKFLSFVMAEHH